jgi:hypothetical protein
MKKKIPLTPAETRAAARTFQFRRTWTCANPVMVDGVKAQCGATLTIRARADRAEGPSNFVPYPTGHRYAGHSALPSDALTWNGLAAERGWETDPVTCRACQAGLTVDEYKQARRG